MDLTVYCDGACEPVNPGGTATWGFAVFLDGELLEEASGVIGSGPAMSNNLAEYTAVVEALRALERLGIEPGSPVTFYGDSMLWVRQLSGDWRVNGGRYLPAYLEARTLLDRLRSRGVTVLLEWVPRERNGEADRLSKRELERLGVPVRTH